MRRPTDRSPVQVRLLQSARDEGLTSTASLAIQTRRCDSLVRRWLRGEGEPPPELLDAALRLMDGPDRARMVALFAETIGAEVVVLPAAVAPALEVLAGAVRRAA
ncbi:MAG: hypothetical protein AAFV53_39330 [Myxococcota bacterium]